PPPPRKLNAEVPLDLETIVLKAIDRDTDRRYQTAAALADDLNRFLQDRPIAARRFSATERLWRWCRRNPALATASGLSGMGLGSALIVSLILAVTQTRVAEAERQSVLKLRAEQERAIAERNRAEENFQIAQKAVDGYLTSVSEDEVLKMEDSVDLR